MSERSAALNFILKLTDQVTAPLGKVKMGFNDLAEKGQANIVQMGAGLAGIVGAGVAITESLQPALEVNRRLAEVRSLGVAEDVLDRLNSKALEFSVAYGENAQEFVASAYDIQGAISGLVGSELATFTTASAIMAKATKASATTMSDYVGTMYGIFQKEADAMGKENWINDLASQTSYALNIFKTNGEGMSSAFTSLGASATSAGIELTEQMGILGTLQATMSGSEAGTKYKAFLAGVGNAQKELGLSFVDSQGRMLPMLDILEKLKGKFGDTLSVAESDQLKKAFGSDEAMALIQLLMPQVDSLGSSIEQLGKIKGLDYATNMAKTMVDPWQQFGAAVQALRIAFGQVLIPILTPLMERLTGIAGTLTRWIDLFPNIAKVIGIATLAVFGITAGIAALTLITALAKTTTLPFIGLWKLLTLVGWRSIAMFFVHAASLSAFVVGLVAMYGWMGLVKGAMLLWQGAIWLTNAALWANPVTWIVIGIVALIAVVAAAIYWWNDWTAALANTAAFQWMAAQLSALSTWFGSMGGWLGMARAAWGSITAIFHGAINSLIEMINKIPGVEINARLGAVPELPDAPGSVQAMAAGEQAVRAQKVQDTINAAIPSLSPQRPTAVPPGGLLTSIQNTQTQNRGTHVEKVEIHTSKPMTPLELENMLEMSAG